MEPNIRRATLAITFVAMLWITLVRSSWAQASAGATYTITELPTLGGTVGAADSINNKGWVAGYANLPGNREEHAVRWINGTITDLETLGGGPNSSVGFPAKNDNGLLVGFSQTASKEPLPEQWNYTCTLSGHVPRYQPNHPGIRVAKRRNDVAPYTRRLH